MLAAVFGLPWGRIGVAAGAVALAMLWLRLEAVTAQRDQQLAAVVAAEAKAIANAASVEQLQAQHAQAMTIITEAAAAERQRLLAAATIKRRVENAPTSSGCAGSPAVAAALDGLRERARSSPTGPDRAPGDPGGPAVLSAGASGAIGGRR